jgi:hypothetical protein
MFNEMYKVSSNLSLAAINLMEMVKLQNYLQSKNIRYYFSSYVNYWNQESHVSPNGDFGLLSYPEVKYLIDEIDFTRWIFSDQKNGTIYEVAKKLNSFESDGFHPGPEAHIAWAELVNSRINQI